VRFTSGTVTPVNATVATEWDLPNDDAGTVTAVTKKSRANGIDVFVVNSITIGPNTYIAGKSAVENNASVDERETGVLIARRKTSPTSSMEDISVMARTMAHEIGHLLFNSVFDDHDSRPWNVMRDGNLGSSNNADLNLTTPAFGHTGGRDSISILPGGANGYNSDESW
jgi:hypothetical protein